MPGFKNNLGTTSYALVLDAAKRTSRMYTCEVTDKDGTITVTRTSGDSRLNLRWDAKKKCWAVSWDICSGGTSASHEIAYKLFDMINRYLQV